MRESELQAHVLQASEATWGEPVGGELVSYFDNGDHIRMTEQAIDLWSEGRLVLNCVHCPETLEHYKQLIDHKAELAVAIERLNHNERARHANVLDYSMYVDSD